MSPSAQIALWGVAALLPVLIAHKHHRLSAMALGTMLVLGWCAARMLATFGEPPATMRWYPLLDAAFGALAFLSWRRERARWKMTLVALFMAQCALHTAFWLAYPQNGQPPEAAAAVLLRYLVANNAIFALELLCVAWAGGLDEWGRRVRDRLSGRPDPFRHAGPAK